MNSMYPQSKGRRLPDDELLTLKQAADHLNVTVAAIRGLIRQKALSRVRVRQRSMVYLSDLNAAARALASGVNVVKANANALQALAEARRLERRMNDMMFVMGVGYELQHVDEETVLRKYNQASMAPESFPHITTPQIVEWARFFFTLDEVFFSIALNVIGDKEPWVPFIQLGVNLAVSRPEECDIEMRTAFEYLEAARRSARCAAYLVCRGHYGKTRADLSFPDTNDADLSMSLLAIIQMQEQQKKESLLSLG